MRTDAETVTLAFAGEEERGGIDTYRFTAAAEAGVIVDPAVLGSLPATLPKDLLGQIAPTLVLTEEQIAQFEQLLSVMPDEVPITYIYSFDKTYWSRRQVSSSMSMSSSAVSL